MFFFFRLTKTWAHPTTHPDMHLYHQIQRSRDRDIHTGFHLANHGNSEKRYTLQGTNIFPKNGIFESMIFLFPRWDMLTFLSANGSLVAWVPVVWILSFIRVPFFVRIPFSYGIPGWIMNHYSWIWVLGFFVVKTHTKKEGPAGASRMKFEMHEPFFGKSYHWSLILGPRILLHGF